MRHRSRLLFSFLFAAAVLAAYAAETGDIKGKVTDEQGQPLPGVEITAAGPALQGTRTVISGKDGAFHFALLPVGRYILTFKLNGFGTTRQENVLVRLGQTTSTKAAIKVPKTIGFQRR